VSKSTSSREAWSIASAVAHGQMKARLDAAYGTSWSWGDSAIHGDYLGGKVTPEGVVRIYEVGDRFVVELRFYSTAASTATAAEQLAAAKASTLEKLLPAIEAKDVRETDPMD
jgi:hypothetical protein